MKYKKAYLVSGAIALSIILFFIFAKTKTNSGNDIIVETQTGIFKVEVNTTGELEARNSTYILGPSNLRKHRIYQVNIQKIIPEGSYVKKGDFIASLDPSELNTKIKDNQLSVADRETKFLQTKLDTALQMREARDKLYNLEFAVLEKKLILEQSQFEPPATIKRAEIEFEKAERQFNQEKENYEIKKQRSEANTRIAYSSLRKEIQETDEMIELQQDFNIRAPQDGMLIYRKGWDGRPMKEGSQINSWDPVVATLPDLSSMNSITFVNEVDIRRIKEGQTVEIGLDAFPDKWLRGKVTQVANVGEQRPNSDSKVFKVVVEIEKIDGSLRPGMTTSNNIITSKVDSSLFIPLECLHSHQDSITYVYLESGLSYKKKEIQIGETNANSVQILMGLKDKDRLYLSKPDDSSDGSQIQLLEALNGKRNKSKEIESEQEPKPEMKRSDRKKPAI